jgi:hypothetical protein
MKNPNFIKFAMDLAEFMDAASVFFSDKGTISAAKIRLQEIGYVSENEEEPSSITLEDLGLDDMNLKEIIIELSRDQVSFKIWTPLSAPFKAAMKRSIPPSCREWDTELHCWRIESDWFGNVQRLFDEHFPNVGRTYTKRAFERCKELIEDHTPEEAPAPPKEKKKAPKKPKQSTPKQPRKPRKPKRPVEKEVDYEDDDDDDDDDDSFVQEGVDPFKILGVTKSAPEEVVKAAYKTLARMYHTDLNGGSDTKIREINAAFEEIKRKRGWK